jgi:hypothetical protein
MAKAVARRGSTGARRRAFWQSASAGYEIVLAPEGDAEASVDYKAFLAPALFWLRSGLLVVRIIASIIGACGLVRRFFPHRRTIDPCCGGVTGHAGKTDHLWGGDNGAVRVVRDLNRDLQ